MNQLINRIPEPELMDSKEQAIAYGMADFSKPHNMFVDLFEKRFGKNINGSFLDLGCGTCDITIRFLKRFPNTRIDAIDGSKAMLDFAQKMIAKENLNAKINIFQLTLPFSHEAISFKRYDGIIVNSLLHHLKDPFVLWNCIKKFIKDNGIIFIMDLIRPNTKEQAREIVEKYSGNEPNILKEDFYNSLLAAYRPDEIRLQLKRCDLDYLNIEVVSDRHFIVWGKQK